MNITALAERPSAETRETSLTAPRIYYLHPLQAGPLAAFGGHLDRCAALGFDHVLMAPPFQAGASGSLLVPADLDRFDQRLAWHDDALAGLRHVAALCRARGLTPLLDVVTDRIASGSPLAADAGALFRSDSDSHPLDPRRYPRGGAAADAQGSPQALAAWWAPRLCAWHEAGIAGFRLLATGGLSPVFIRTLTGMVRGSVRDCLFLGWTPGVPQPALSALVGSGLDFVFCSLPWWDFRGDWFWQEYAALSRIGRVLAAPEAPFGRRLFTSCHDPRHVQACYRRAIGFAAALGEGWLLPMGCEVAAAQRLDAAYDAPEAFAAALAAAPFDLATIITDANRATAQLAEAGETRVLSAPGASIITLLKADAPDARFARQTSVVIASTDLAHRRRLATAGLFSNAGASFVPFTPGEPVDLEPGEVRVVPVDRSEPILLNNDDMFRTAMRAAHTPRIAIEAVTPSVDEGRFPARRVVGDLVTVEADIICDGHDVLGVMLAWRCADQEARNEVPMRPLGNDRFAASFPLLRLGLHEFSIEAWRDEFATYRSELAKKHAAGLDVSLELEEGRLLVARAREAAVTAQDELATLSSRLAEGTTENRLAALLSDDVAALMARVDRRPFLVRITPPFPLEAERSTAQFASWYEIFPRSMSDDASRHGTFDDVIRHLPRIRAMGFDVLYFPPIHPIGRTNRKGRNNSLTPAPDDPGSPYAIGSHEGGHDAIHRQLGTFDDFRRLREAAAAHGLELALDFAIQCAPDHPWLTEHRDWFAWRPDGSIRYAENPPKKYQDIVNVDFYGEGGIPSLWVALCNIVLFWAERNIRIFRVDNPHTKPLPFWHWLIREVKSRYPDTMFLAEAFTKPKMMYRLAKVGFSQSYTYFTWRDTRADLTAYLEELTTTAPKDFFRPIFFVNTPDINPLFVQNAGRAAFVIRTVLAATLSGLWGLYSGFELCEARALPGREEYADAEKYEIKAWDWDRPGNIIPEITALNHIRRRNPALQTHLGVRFLGGWNPSVLVYEKATADRSNVILVAVNLDPGAVQESDIELPLRSWALADDGALAAEDLLAGGREVWHGKQLHLRLDPQVRSFDIWRVSPAA